MKKFRILEEINRQGERWFYIQEVTAAGDWWTREASQTLEGAKQKLQEVRLQKEPRVIKIHYE